MFVRCGICDKNFKSQEAWDEHAKGERHQKLVAMWRILEMEARAKNEHFLMKGEILEARRLVDTEKITVEEMNNRFHKALLAIAERP